MAIKPLQKKTNMVTLNIPHAVETRKQILSIRADKRQKDLENFCANLSKKILEATRLGNQNFKINWPESFIKENEEVVTRLLSDKGYKYHNDNSTLSVYLT